MKLPPPPGEMRRLAQQLLAHETMSLDGSESSTPVLIRVSEKFRILLTRLSGTAGYYTLLVRALVLAKVHAPGTSPALAAIRIMPDGSLGGLKELPNDDETTEASLLVISQLLELLVVFIGKDLVLRLLSDTWPGLSLVDAGAQQEVKNDPTN